MAIAVKLIAEEKVRDTGLLIPEYAFDPKDVFDELEKREIYIHEEINEL